MDFWQGFMLGVSAAGFALWVLHRLANQPGDARTEYLPPEGGSVMSLPAGVRGRSVFWKPTGSGVPPKPCQPCCHCPRG